MRVDLGRTRSGMEDHGATKVLLIRHGECEAQVSRMHGVEGLDSSLTSKGQRQALALAAAIEPIHPAMILTSPLTRCVETAAEIATHLVVPVSVSLELREVLARKVRLPRSAMLAERARCQLGGDRVGDEGWLHGDLGFDAAVSRAESVIAHLGSEYRGHVVAAVTHGGFGSYLIAAAVRAADVWFQLDNGSVTTLRWPTDPVGERPGWEMYPPVRVELLAVNDVSHLGAARSVE